MGTRAFFIIDSEEKRANAARYVASIKRTPVQCVEVKDYKTTRSLAQNRMYHMWKNTISEETGYTTDQLHEMFKEVFLGVTVEMLWGRPVIIRKSTTDLDVKAFTDFLIKIETFAQQQGIILPRPDDYMNAIYGERIK